MKLLWVKYTGQTDNSDVIMNEFTSVFYRNFIDLKKHKLNV